MIKKHEINTAIGHPALTDLESYLSEAIAVTDQLVALLYAVNEFEDTRDDDDFLDAIDTAAVMQVNGIHIFESCRLSSCSAINKYLARTLSVIDQLLALLDKYSVASMTPVDDAEEDGLQRFKELIKQAIAGMTHFVCYEFSLFDYTEDVANGVAKPDVDEVYYGVTSKSGNIDATNKAIELCALAHEFKQRLDIFDEYPEKEAEFEKIMGPFAVELNDEALTVELIDSVISGNMTPQELLAITNPNQDEDDTGVAEMDCFSR